MTVPVTTVILDGVVPPVASLVHFDKNMGHVGRDFMAACGADTFCASAFAGSDPFTRVDELFEAMGDDPKKTCLGKIPGGSSITPTMVASMLGTLVQESLLRTFIPPIVNRMLRCKERDVVALTNLIKYIMTMPPILPQFPSSPLLFLHVTFSDLFGPGAPATPGEVQEWYDESHFVTSSPGSTVDFRKMWEEWPKYEHDRELYGRWPVEFARKVPILMLNGDLDPNTPFAWAAWAARSLAGTKAVLVPFHEAPHGVVVYGDVPGTKVPCGMTIMGTFINSKDHVADTSCIKKSAPIDWKGVDEVTMAKSFEVFGTRDMWELL